jgi:hypothetical protein
MRTFLLLLCIIFLPTSNAQDVASCGEPNGTSFYAHFGAVTKDKSGWQKDGIKDGNFTLRRLSRGKFDMFYQDLYKNVGSAVSDGATVLPLRAGADHIAVLVAYPDATELYTFWITPEGRMQYVFQQTKKAPVGLLKTAMFVGECRFINFSLMD